MFVKGRLGLRTLFGIKLDNVLEVNAINDIGGKREGRVQDKSQAEVEEHDHVCFSKTCKKTIKYLRKLLEEEREAKLKIIKKYMFN